MTVRKRRFWVAVAVLVIVAGVLVPLIGLYEISTAADDVGAVADLRASFEDVDQDLTALGVAQRDYELSGTSAATRDGQRLSAVSRADASLTADAAGLTAAAVGRSSLAATLRPMLNDVAVYQAAVSTRTAALLSGTDTPALAQQQTASRGLSLTTSTAFTKALAADSDAALGTLSHSRDVSLVASGTAAVALLTLIAWLAVSGTRSREHALAAAGGRVAAAEKVADQRAQMVNLASHELRNPLAAMFGAAQLIEEQAEDTADAGLLELARAALGSARQAETLVAELLDLSRIDAGMLKLDISRVAPAPIVASAISATRARHGDRDIVVLGEPGDVRADPVRLSIIIRNLIDNGVKYSRPPGVVSVAFNHPDTEHLLIDVTDDGPGVPAARTEAIFERFNRLEQTQSVPGVGIGLHLSRELARRMGGDLQALSELHGGHFRLTLPADIPLPTPRVANIPVGV